MTDPWNLLYNSLVAVPHSILVLWQMSHTSEVSPNLKSFEMPRFDQIQMDWNKSLISDIYAVGENERCKGADEPVFGSIWFGAEHMCVEDFGQYKSGTFENIDSVYVSKGETCESRRES